uniref:ENTH domain-containing protein n=1 Tax=Bos indicus x Bos taurus TaxID=30522 RepID=A0A4W2C3I6_BOBOX
MAFRRQVKNFVKNYSDAEIKVREATSNDPWGPSSSLMLDISDLTFNTISLSEIMNMLWQRLNDHGKNWRHVYKSLTLMDYLIKNGSKKVIQHCREGYCNLQTLKDFQHIDEAGKDQGYYIREKSKQVITLLMDEQLLHREREVACRTRRRTSYSMTFPKRLPGAGNSPTACASAPTPEIPVSEKKNKLLKIARLHNKKNTSKAGQKQEQCQDMEVPSGTVLSQETPIKINAWKSTEVSRHQYFPFYYFYSSFICYFTDAVPVPSEKTPSLQTNVSLVKNLDSTITKTVTGNPLQMPLEKQPAAKSCDTLTTLQAHWPSSQEEFIGPHLRTSKSDSTFRNQASVETLYVSPSFTTFDPMKETVISKGHQKATRSGLVPMEDENLKTLATWVSAASEGTFSFSTLSVSSPDSASPVKSVHPLPPVLAGPSFWTLSRQQSSSASVKNIDKTARIHHPFAPRSPLSSNEKENEHLNLLEILPDNSGSAEEKTSSISSSNWVAFSTQNVDHFTSMSCSSSQATKDLSREPEADSSTNVLLGEVKNAIVTLHEDLSMVIRELNVISSRLVSMSGSSPQISKSLQFPQYSEAGSDQV